MRLIALALTTAASDLERDPRRSTGGFGPGIFRDPILTEVVSGLRSSIPVSMMIIPDLAGMVIGEPISLELDPEWYSTGGPGGFHGTWSAP